ncbi:MAG: glycosyltransferase [Proteobacteria bacterium]|nr:glycosyltransferase [Pseudomonadota bacterium]
MRVSIIIPSYNKGEFLEETLTSIFEQDYGSIEIVIVDAESTDDTDAIVNKYRERINVYVREPDKGQSDAINKGARLASGEVIGWLNADDLLFPGAIKKIAATFSENPQVGVVYGAGAKIDLSGQVVKDIPYRPFDISLLKKMFFILQPSMYFKRKLFHKVGGLNVESHLAMDWEFVLKMLPVTDFLAIPDKIAKLRMYDGTKTSGGGWNTYREIARIGREQNGIFDVNFLSFIARNIVSGIPVPLVKKYLRSLVVLFCDFYAGKGQYMICKWPEDFQNHE